MLLYAFNPSKVCSFKVVGGISSFTSLPGSAIEVLAVGRSNGLGITGESWIREHGEDLADLAGPSGLASQRQQLKVAAERI